MKQILQMLGNGDTIIADVPAPAPHVGHVLIHSQVSLISAGTERMLVDFGKANIIDKARQQPERVRQVLDKVRTDGLFPTVEAVRSKLNQPIALGYCNVGVVANDTCGGTSFRPGQRVVSNGCHASVVRVPNNLCAAIPDNVDDDSAVFTVLGAIALQGVRLAEVTLGECVVVMGMGLIGLLTVQILRANGCRVLATDYDASRLELAARFGAETLNVGDGSDLYSVANRFSRSRGVDAVLITASTSSNEPVRQAAKISRKRGRIVMVGVTGTELPRTEFFEKELSFRVSCSYGPGRYDAQYEEKGIDYPVGYVRWTEQRNFEAVLDLMSRGALNTEPLISHRFEIDSALEAYELLGANEPTLGMLIDYELAESDQRVQVLVEEPETKPESVSISVVGAGNYSSRVLIPAFNKCDVNLRTLCGSSGVNATIGAKKFGFDQVSTDANATIEDEFVNVVVIATPHNSHAELVIDAIEAGKHVFVEKPLCLTRDDVKKIQSVAEDRPQISLMVGFNRRFAPLTEKLMELLEPLVEPKSIVITVNAGNIPPEHWVQQRDVGGGRIVGEACHFIDLARYISSARISQVSVTAMRGANNECGDKASIAIEFEDGSHATIHYLANGHSSFPKERIEVFCGGKVLQLDNFRRLTGWGFDRFKSTTSRRQNKGQDQCVARFVESVKCGQQPPIPLEEILEVSLASIDAQEEVF